MLTRDIFFELVGEEPPPVAAEPRLGDPREEHGCWIAGLEYWVEPGERVSSVVVWPQFGAPPFPVALAIHTTGGDWSLGKSKMLGAGGNPPVAFELARAGFLVLAPDSVGYEDRRQAGFTRWGPEQADWRRMFFELSSRLLAGSTLLAKNMADLRRGLDAVLSLPMADSSNVVAVGHSFGAGQAAILAVIDPRTRAAVSSCGTTNNRVKLQKRLDIGFSYCLPGLLRHGDIGDILGLAAPTPLLVLSAREDPSCEGHDEMVAAARQAYSAAGAPSAVQHRWFPGGHEFSDDARRAAYEWLSAVLVTASGSGESG